MPPKLSVLNKKAKLDAKCKFCKRLKSKIPWRGNDGLQCRSCPRVIAADPELQNRDKGELAEELAEGSDALNEYLAKVEEWEAANPYQARSAPRLDLSILRPLL